MLCQTYQPQPSKCIILECSHEGTPARPKALVEVVYQIGNKQIGSTMAQLAHKFRNLVLGNSGNHVARLWLIVMIVLQTLLHFLAEVPLVRLLTIDEHVGSRVCQARIRRGSWVVDNLTPQK
jgi:hypothetical protein